MDIVERLQTTFKPTWQELAADAAEEIERLRNALRRIERWEGEFPATGRFWDEPKSTQPMSYSACYGSNGERDYMRQVARDALATHNVEHDRRTAALSPGVRVDGPVGPGA